MTAAVAASARTDSRSEPDRIPGHGELARNIGWAIYHDAIAISPAARLTWDALLVLHDHRKPWISTDRRVLARMTKQSEETIRKSERELRRAGLLETRTLREHRAGRDGRKATRSRFYRLLLVEQTWRAPRPGPRAPEPDRWAGEPSNPSVSSSSKQEIQESLEAASKTKSPASAATKVPTANTEELRKIRERWPELSSVVGPRCVWDTQHQWAESEPEAVLDRWERVVPVLDQLAPHIGRGYQGPGGFIRTQLECLTPPDQPWLEKLERMEREAEAERQAAELEQQREAEWSAAGPELRENLVVAETVEATGLDEGIIREAARCVDLVEATREAAAAVVRGAVWQLVSRRRDEELRAVRERQEAEEAARRRRDEEHRRRRAREDRVEETCRTLAQRWDTLEEIPSALREAVDAAADRELEPGPFAHIARRTATLPAAIRAHAGELAEYVPEVVPILEDLAKVTS